MLGHHGFWGLNGASQLGLFRDGATATFQPQLVKATATFLPPQLPTEGACSADGQFVWHGGAWARRAVNESCASFTNITSPTSTVHGTACASPPSDGVVVRPYEIFGKDDPLYDVTIVLAAQEGVPITYYLSCVNPNVLALSNRQLDAIVASLQDPVGGPVRGSLFGGDTTDLAILIPGGRGQAWKTVYQGTTAIWKFNTPDGDTKNVFLVMGFDQGVNTFTFTWSHQPTMFQSIDSFITSISPWDPSGTLCSLLPVATKVPNPYVAVGSIVLEMSGKCPASCPTGMLYDANAKTCSCPPGTAYDVNAKICMPLAPPSASTSTTIPTWIIVVGVVVGFGLLATIFGKSPQPA